MSRAGIGAGIEPELLNLILLNLILPIITLNLTSYPLDHTTDSLKQSHYFYKYLHNF